MLARHKAADGRPRIDVKPSATYRRRGDLRNDESGDERPAPAC
jgi:hypothetical protein